MATSLGESFEMLAASCHGSSMAGVKTNATHGRSRGPVLACHAEDRPHNTAWRRKPGSGAWVKRTAPTTQSSPFHTNLAAVAKLSVPALQLLEHLRRIPHRRQHQIHEHMVSAARFLQLDQPGMPKTTLATGAGDYAPQDRPRLTGFDVRE